MATSLQPYPLGEAPRLVVPRDKAASLASGHPWVFAAQVAKAPKNLPAGAVVELVDDRGRFLGRGGYNDASRILVRLFTTADEPVDAAFIERRLAAAAARRADLLADGTTDCCRLVFAEADGLPGLVIDQYGDWAVLQVLSAASEAWRDTIVAWLAGRGLRGVYERSDSEDRRRHEGLEPRVGCVWGEEPPDELLVREHGLVSAVDVRAGHKTGAYLDQRDNRAVVAALCGGRSVLNAFAYTGGFGLHAAAAGAANVLHVDSSAPALERARANAGRNPGAAGQEFQRADVFEALRGYAAEGRRFDAIILDPPKFAASRKQLDRAARGYRDLNAAALRLLEPGGLLATFSCSGAVDPGLFQRLVADAAADARRQVQVVRVLGQPPDHPVLLSFPEGWYLKGLVGLVVG